MTRHRGIFAAVLITLGLISATISNAGAAVVITGSVGNSGKYLVSGAPIAANKEEGVLKITFETRTPGFNLSLCLGALTDFGSGTCTKNLVGSGGPGFIFLSIVNVAELDGQVFFVKRNVGNGTASFAITME
jgi:hypothetical protein